MSTAVHDELRDRNAELEAKLAEIRRVADQVREDWASKWPTTLTMDDIFAAIDSTGEGEK